jgi:hypothetical protein
MAFSIQFLLQVPDMMSECFKQIDVKFKTIVETSFKTLSNTGLTYTITNLIPFTVYDVVATVRSPRGLEKDGIPTKIKTAEDGKKSARFYVVMNFHGTFSIDCDCASIYSKHTKTPGILRVHL